MKRVIVVGGKGLPGVDGTGGVEVGIYRLNRLLLSKGYRVIVYQRGSKASWERVNNIIVRNTPFINRKYHAFWSHTIISFWDYLKIKKKNDIVHLHNIQNGIFVVLFRLIGCKVVFHLHGPEWKASKWNHLMRLFMIFSSIPAVLFSNAFISVNPINELRITKFLSCFRSTVFYIPNGILNKLNYDSFKNTGDFEIKGFHQNNFWLYVGRIVEQKNILSAIDAYYLSNSSFPFVFAGSLSHSSKYFRKIKHKISDLNLESKVIFLGQLDWPKLDELYRSCRAVILVSSSEGCSNVICEAISYNKTIVCTDLLSNKNLLEDNAFYISKKRIIVELSECLKKLERNLDFRLVAYDKSKRTLLTWDEVARKVDNIYKYNQ